MSKKMTKSRRSTADVMRLEIEKEDNEREVKWVPDKLRKKCRGCSLKFTSVRRQHHCRHCGEIFCSKCSSRKMPLGPTSKKPVRICDVCYDSFLPPSFVEAVRLDDNESNNADEALDSEEEALMDALEGARIEEG